MNQDELNQILGALPQWASEETMTKLASADTVNISTMTKVAAILGKTSAADVKKIKSAAEQAATGADNVAGFTEAVMVKGNKALSIATTDMSAAGAMAEIAHESSKILANVGISVGNLTSRFGVVGKGFGFLAKSAGKIGVVTTGLGVVFAGLLTEQQKEMKQLIDMGSVAGDLTQYTALRASVAKLGMGMKQYSEMSEAAKPFLISASGDVLDGQIAMSKFINNIAQDKVFHDYGLAVQDQSALIAQEAETLYQLGEITEMNAYTKGRVLDSFASANKLAVFSGNNLGMQRSEALRLRDEARNSVDFQVALIQNADAIAESLGEGAAKNISDAVGFFAILNAGTFGEDFAKQFQEDTTNTLADIKFDQSAANNIPAEILAKFRAMGPGVAESYIKLIEDTATGKITSEADAMSRQREFAELVKNQSITVAGFDPLLNQANEFKALTNTIPDSYWNADVSELASSSYYIKMMDKADGSIDVIDDMAIGFKNMQELLTPGYEGMGKGAEMLTDSMMALGNATANLFGRGTEFEEIMVVNRQKQIDAAIAQVQTVEVARATIAKNEFDQAKLVENYDELTELQTSDPVEGEDELTEEELSNHKKQQDSILAKIAELKIYHLALLEKRTKLQEELAVEEAQGFQ